MNSAIIQIVKNAILVSSPVFNDFSTNTNVVAVDTGRITVLTIVESGVDSTQLLMADLDIQLKLGSPFTLATVASRGTTNVDISISLREVW